MDAICGWIQKITEYLMLVSIMLAVVPGKDYKKYIQFFAGIMFLLLCCTPILQIMNKGDIFPTMEKNTEYEISEEINEKKEKVILETDLTDYLPQKMKDEQTTSGNEIKVEEIKVE